MRAEAPPADRSMVASVRGELPEEIAVGAGTALFVDGGCELPAGEIESLSVLAGGRPHRAIGWGAAAPGERGSDYWWAIVGIDPVEGPRRLELSLEAGLRRGGRVIAPLGAVGLVPDLPPVEPERSAELGERQRQRGGGGPLVAICMAGFEPDLELFARQIESIRRQRHSAWICLISDDGSSPRTLGRMRELIGADERFLISPAESNAGFYRNFERALRMVPPQARLIALSDQDDAWHEDKLAALVEAIERERAELAYSDMRVVNAGGAVLSPTYWSFRRNNWTDFGSLLIANTVTGAASIFRAELLDSILPFPPPYPKLFHDHWIAQVAMARGELAYVDRPLYDYVQHEGAELGHLAANGAGRFSGPLARQLASSLIRFGRRGLRPGWRAPYFNVWCRVALTTSVLRRRFPAAALAPDRAGVLEKIGAPGPRAGWLATRAIRDLRGPTETIGRERVMLAGLAWRGSLELRKRLRRLAGRA